MRRSPTSKVDIVEIKVGREKMICKRLWFEPRTFVSVGEFAAPAPPPLPTSPIYLVNSLIITRNQTIWTTGDILGNYYTLVWSGSATTTGGKVASFSPGLTGLEQVCNPVRVHWNRSRSPPQQSKQRSLTRAVRLEVTRPTNQRSPPRTSCCIRRSQSLRMRQPSAQGGGYDLSQNKVS